MELRLAASCAEAVGWRPAFSLWCSGRKSMMRQENTPGFFPLFDFHLTAVAEGRCVCDASSALFRSLAFFTCSPLACVTDAYDILTAESLSW